MAEAVQCIEGTWNWCSQMVQAASAAHDEDSRE